MEVEKVKYRPLKLPFQKIIGVIKDQHRVNLVKKRGKDYYRSIKRLSNYTETDLEKVKIFRSPFVGRNTIVVYPDYVYGNPLWARKVVRYFLYFNQFPGDERAYGKNDLFICFRKLFNDWDLNPQGLEVCVSGYDLNLYKRTNYGKREGKCYIIKKGHNREDLPKEYDGYVIDQYYEEADKVRIFNETEYCISYDTQTAYSTIAALCGCISVVVPEKGKTRKDYLLESDKGYGIAYGFSDEEISYAKKTMSLVKGRLEEINRTGIEETRKFAEICIRYFS